METLYLMVPTTNIAKFKDLDPVTRMVFACIWDRYKLSVKSYREKAQFKMDCPPELMPYYGGFKRIVYCVITQQEIAEALGITERTARSCVAKLKKAAVIDTHRDGYQAATRYTIRWDADKSMVGGFADFIQSIRKG